MINEKRKRAFDKIDNSDFKKLYNSYIIGEIKLSDFAVACGVSVYYLQIYFKEHNLGNRTKTRRLLTNDNFFDKIDNEITAYLFGFYLADGSIDNCNRICISLSEIDYEIIELFRDNICPIAHISRSKCYTNKKTGYTSKPMISIQITSKHICESLNKRNVGQNKTNLEINDLSFINDDVFIHFLRGYFDGDGTVYSNIVNKQHKCLNGEIKKYKFRNYNWSIIAHKNNHLKIIQKKLLEDYKIYSNIINDNRGNYLLMINRKKDFFLMRDLLYKKCNFFLKRKHSKFMNIPLQEEK